MNGASDPLIGAAAAEVLRHHLIDVSVAGLGGPRQQISRPHDLSRLAVAALGHLLGHPRLLDPVASVGGETLDGDDGLPLYRRNRELAGLLCHPDDVHGAVAALPHAAAEPGTCRLDGLARNRHEWRGGGDVDRAALAVEGEARHANPRQAMGGLQRAIVSVCAPGSMSEKVMRSATWSTRTV